MRKLAESHFTVLRVKDICSVLKHLVKDPFSEFFYNSD